MTDQKQQYLIEPKHKKSVCEEQIWKNTLKNGKSVSVKVGNVYRGGEFHITINKKEQAELLTKKTILLNNYDDCEMLSMWDGGCDFWVDIVDEDKYSEEELNEIKILLYKSSKDDDNDDDEFYDEEKMFINGWDETECEYILNAPFILTLVEDE
jgi:hypothetical protein